MSLLIRPRWRVPASIWAATFTRRLTQPLTTPLLADLLDPAVDANRLAALPAFEQVHGVDVLDVDELVPGARADACFTRQPYQPCLVRTADCLPVLFCDDAATEVAAAHAGWRGLAAGVLEQTAQQLRGPPEKLSCWLGPAIGQAHFEVGGEVLEQFLRFAHPRDKTATRACFQARGEKKYLADLYQLARLRLRRLGVASIAGGEYCTYARDDLFHSYRRDGERSGRLYSVIMMT